MDKIDAMRLFTRIVERRSFSAAASDSNLPRSTVTEAMKQLEARLGVRLLQRTTRHVAPTLDGGAYYRRCLGILADIEEAEGAFSDGPLHGLLRIDVHGTLARHFVIPKLPAFLDRHPGLRLHIGEGDRLVDLVREGVDCVIRAGKPQDGGMVVRRLGLLAEATCASPAYLERFGTPATPGDLDGHRMIGFVSSGTGEVMPLEFGTGAEVRRIVLPSHVTVTGAEMYAMLARLGLGLIQAPRYRLMADFASGALAEVLPGFPPPFTPVSVLYPHRRQLSPRVRVFIDWLVQIFAGQLPDREPSATG